MSGGGHVIRNRITIRNGYDADDLIIPGDYAVSAGANVPSAGIWVIEVRVADSDILPRQIHQLAVSVEGDDMYQRSYNGTVWTAWSISGGGGGGATNLNHTRAATTITIESDTGADTTIPAADTDLAGVMTADMFDKLDGIAAGATAYTDELAQDAVGTILSDAGDIDFTYDDVTPAISAVIKAGAVDEAHLSFEVVTKTSVTGAANMPSGTTAQRPGSPVAGQLRWNSDLVRMETYNGAEWGTIGGDNNLFNYMNLH